MKRLVIGLVLFSIFLVTHPVLAVDRVVVIPLGGVVGDAVPEDVVRDKTFSSQAGKGLTGTRFPTPLKKTGQTTKHNLNDDAFYLKGIDTTPRWTYMQPNSGGIFIRKSGYGYRDNNTGLIWLVDASNIGMGIIAALNYCEDLETVPSIPGLYIITDWRLPNIVELLSLVDYGQVNPALPSDHHFTGIVLGAHYWSSTTNANDPTKSWTIDSTFGDSTNTLFKGTTTTGFIMCVRD